jgi:hypothetical protein
MYFPVSTELNQVWTNLINNALQVYRGIEVFLCIDSCTFGL